MTTLPNPFVSTNEQQSDTRFELDEAKLAFDWMQLFKLSDAEIDRINEAWGSGSIPLFLSNPSDEYLETLAQFRRDRWNLGRK